MNSLQITVTCLYYSVGYYSKKQTVYFPIHKFRLRLILGQDPGSLKARLLTEASGDASVPRAEAGFGTSSHRPLATQPAVNARTRTQRHWSQNMIHGNSHTSVEAGII